MIALLGLCVPPLSARTQAADQTGGSPPVQRVAPDDFAVEGPEGRGRVRYFGTASLDASSVRIVRGIVNVHGILRNADIYERTGEAMLRVGGVAGETLLVTPQFLLDADVERHALPRETLRWQRGRWLDGSPAVAPAPLSAFTVLDAIGRRMADRTRFPSLREIVFIGHSAGAQLIQRYAVVGRLGDAIPLPGVAIRYVVANPSSYLYFDRSRPAGEGFAAYPTERCPGFDRWKYGSHAPPPYVDAPIPALEQQYVRRRVTYLLGQRDNDPTHPALDTSCAGRAQGPDRLSRGRAFARYLRLRHPEGTNHDVAEVVDVGHDGRRMFTSPCGVAVVLDRPRPACAGASQI